MKEENLIHGADTFWALDRRARVCQATDPTGGHRFDLRQGPLASAVTWQLRWSGRSSAWSSLDTAQRIWAASLPQSRTLLVVKFDPFICQNDANLRPLKNSRTPCGISFCDQVITEQDGCSPKFRQLVHREDIVSERVAMTTSFFKSESFGTQIRSSDEKKGNRTVGSNQVTLLSSDDALAEPFALVLPSSKSLGRILENISK
ncbi:hypothetical protein MJT46_013364 [Ovis ammon polii x Ovis aries]|nr:hypothetical protein MJT46_013364 [Ovis ammon polii x Ovis aries]